MNTDFVYKDNIYEKEFWMSTPLPQTHNAGNILKWKEKAESMRSEQINVTNDVKDLNCACGIAFAMSQESKPTTNI